MGGLFFSDIEYSSAQLRSVNHTIKKLTKRFDLEKDIRPKSLIKTFYEWRRGDKDSYRYIPNFDTLAIEQQREVVSLWIGKEEASKLSNEAVTRIFNYKISSSVKELEQDISSFS